MSNIKKNTNSPRPLGIEKISTPPLLELLVL